jgi:hypothetical protein
MSSFTLTNTADEIDSAISRVNSADSTPTANSQSMVTSGGVFDYFSSGIGSFQDKTLTTSATGIAATDNDTSVPTSAAVNDAIRNAVKVASYSLANRDANFSTAYSPYPTPVPETIIEDSDPSNMGTVSGNNKQLELTAGTYVISLTGEVYANFGTTYVQVLPSGVVGTITNAQISGSSSYPLGAANTIITSAGTLILKLIAQTSTGWNPNVMRYRNVALTVVKLA